MEILANAAIVLVTFFMTEFSAWANHKFVMHGFLWSLHKDHHVPHKGWFEWNDLFFLMYAIPSWLLIMYGLKAGGDFRAYIGIGIVVYGIAYFLVHEVIIHRRLKWLDRTDSIWIRTWRKAHKIHHKTLGKEGAKCFGMLIVPKKYYNEAQAYFEKRR